MRREEEEAARSELVSLIRVPQEHRTADQVRRITAASRILSTAHKRKRKKRRKKRPPKSSSFRSSSGVLPRRCGQGSRSRSSSFGGCGRLREHVRQVPAVADLQWKVPPSISSTMCGHSGYAAETGTVVHRCSTRTRLFPCPVLCYDWPSWSRECKNLWSSHRCSSWTRLFSCLVLCNDWPSWSSQCRKPRWCRSCSSSKVDGLPSCRRDKSMVLPVQKTIETPQLQSVMWSMLPCHARCRSDRCLWFRHCRKLWRCRCCSSSIFWIRSSTSLSWCRDSFPWSCSGP